MIYLERRRGKKANRLSFLFFEISRYHLNCFLEQVSSDNKLFIKYKIFSQKRNGTKVDIESIKNFEPKVQFQVIKDKYPIFSRYINNLTGELVFKPKKPDYYKIITSKIPSLNNHRRLENS